MKKPALLAIAPAATAIAIAIAGCGGFLTDSAGRALYLFVADRTSASTCYSACASIWPPLTSSRGGGGRHRRPGIQARHYEAHRRHA